MRVVIQRVLNAQVVINNSTKSAIDAGLLILVGFEHQDNEADLDWMAKKITGLRIFDDQNGVMNLSVNDIDGEILVVSQFTLHAKTQKGNRPSYIMAARPEIAIPLYNKFIDRLRGSTNLKIRTGEFGADMKVTLTNDGPVTIIIDSKNKE